MQIAELPARCLVLKVKGCETPWEIGCGQIEEMTHSSALSQLSAVMQCFGYCPTADWQHGALQVGRCLCLDSRSAVSEGVMSRVLFWDRSGGAVRYPGEEALPAKSPEPREVLRNCL
mmetsp:Transcript_208/g.318  ORF Transcript_208/g.318 Transcript_208/m.318 type:complete len:117 (-) Transcript_208:506-856(-)